MNKSINRCINCNSTLTYLRMKSNTFTCRKCGAIWPYIKPTGGENHEQGQTRTNPENGNTGHL